MASRTPQAQSLHNQMVVAHARRLQRELYRDVRADDVTWITGLPAPQMIGGYVPDLTAVSLFNVPLIVEVETADSINIAHTRGQWAAFANYAWRVRGIFRVVVPPYALGAAQAAARLWGIPVGEFRGEDGRSKAA